MEELILLRMTATKNEQGETVIKAITPVSSVEMTTPSEEVALQAYAQLGQRLLTTIESELDELKSDLELDS